MRPPFFVIPPAFAGRGLIDATSLFLFVALQHFSNS